MKTAIRGSVLTFNNDPFQYEMNNCMVFEEDAIIVMENGKITEFGKASEVLKNLPKDINVKTYNDSIIMAGFIDSHVHYPQTEMIAAYGKQLIDWLNNYTFIAEQGFIEKSHAAEVAEVFIKEQFRNGVTSSTVYSTVFSQSVDALFEEAAKHNMRIMTGKVCMDRNAPEALLDTAQKAYDESKALIEKWHKKGRAEYVITPRFAPTSTEEQLELVGTLAGEYKDTLIQSHLSENVNEIAWVKELYPNCKDYTDVYYKYGLLRERAIYGHGIHLSESELDVLSSTGTAIAHCPTSNFFLGSGYFDVKRARDFSVKVGLATDVGAGTSFSILQTMNEAYKAAQLNNFPLSAGQAYYMATLGTAKSLSLQDKIGSIEVGKEADITVLDLKSTPLIEYRMRYAKDLDEILFIQMTLGDDRAIAATYVAGKCVYSKL